MSEKPWRLFVGAFPPPEVAFTLQSAIDDWRGRIADRSVKWVSADKIHLTLCFLGNVDPSCVDALSQELRKALSADARFSLSISGLGVFPNLNWPRVFWVGVEGDVEKLFSVQKSIASVCAPFIAFPDDKPFSAHITLARLKDPGRETVGKLQRVVESGPTTYCSWPVDEIHLIRSELGSESKYTVLKAWKLQ